MGRFRTTVFPAGGRDSGRILAKGKIWLRDVIGPVAGAGLDVLTYRILDLPGR